MLIIEGSDLTGKTTLCKKLASDIRLVNRGYVYKHFSRLPSGFNFVGGYFQNAVERSVQDRFHMSEIVYSKARSEPVSPLDSQDYRLVDAGLRALGSFTVVLVAEPNLLMTRYSTRDRQEMYDLQLILDANSYFADIAVSHEFFDNSDRMYSCIDVDAVINLTEKHPWPNEEDLENILTVYLHRMESLRSTRLLLRESQLPYLQLAT